VQPEGGMERIAQNLRRLASLVARPPRAPRMPCVLRSVEAIPGNFQT